MAFVVAFAIAVVATPLAMRAAVALGVLDRPGPLKTHVQPVPYLGGAALLVAVGIVLAPTHPSWMIAPTLACALGVADDRFGVPPVARLAVEVVIGVVAGIVVPAPGPVGWLVTAVVVVGLMNAVNLIDGLDGLASGVVAASALALAVADPGLRVLALPLAGALLAFLLYNRPPARIYLGDGGAYFLGAVLGMLIALSLHGGAAHWFAAPLFVAVPAGDTLIAIMRRLRGRRPLMSGDRSHVYDQLVDRGWSRGLVAATFVAVQIVAGGVAIVVWRLDAGEAVLLAVGAVVVLGAAAVGLGFTKPARATS